MTKQKLKYLTVQEIAELTDREKRNDIQNRL